MGGLSLEPTYPLAVLTNPRSLDTIVTSSTHPIDGGKDLVVESVLASLTKRTEDPRLRNEASETDIQKLSRLIVQVCCGFYDEALRDSLGNVESVRHIFSNTINDIVSDRNTSMFFCRKSSSSPASARQSGRQFCSRTTEIGIPTTNKRATGEKRPTTQRRPLETRPPREGRAGRK